jgi:hypothetical protein
VDAGLNALDNAAQRVRVDAAADNLPFIVYAIGLGNALGGVNAGLLQRIANDPAGATFQSNHTAGIYMYAPDAGHIASAFSAIAGGILRLSK